MAHQDEGKQTICGRAKSGRLRALLAVLAAAPCLIGTGQAQEASEGLPREPILRLETGHHGAQINCIDTDAENRFAVTASNDKTVRVWSLSDGRLLKTLRLPLDLGDIGKSHAVAISPDGNTVAVGGDTGNQRPHNIFLFDRDLGELIKRIPDLPDAVLHLAYSTDGQRLVASLQGGNGIRVFDTGKGYRPLPSDVQYKDSSYWATFDRARRLVTTSDDGFVRLYPADRYEDPIAQFPLEGHRPYAAAFSPDGTQVAVGYETNPPKVMVLSGSNLSRLFEADTAGLGYHNLQAVAWSQDGRFLFAGGQWSGKGVNQVRRWSKGGQGAFKEIPAGYETIMEILGLKSGFMLFAHTDGFGRISPDAKIIPLQQRLSGLDLMADKGLDLQISADASTVEIDAYQPRHTYRFALGERRVDVDPSADVKLLVPITQAPGLAVTNWEDKPTPAVNGTPIKLTEDEFARSLAIAPGAQHFLLGADWSLRLFDDLGQEVWPVAPPVPGEAWHVNITSDGRLVVVAYGDGTIRWLRLSDGKELLALFIHPDGKRWVAWTPQGYYEASVGGEEFIGWAVNRGYDHAPDFYLVSRFRDQFNRPDVVALVLETLDVGEAVRRANAASGHKTAAAVADSLPPVVKIVSPADQSSNAKSPIEVVYFVRSPTPVTGITVLVDGRPVATAPPKAIESRPDRTVSRLSIDVPQQEAMISLVAANEKGSSEAAIVHIQWEGAKDRHKPDLYVLAVGVSKYKDESLDLAYSDKDAEDFVRIMKAQEGRRYGHVYPRDLPDNRATREEIRKGLSWLENKSRSQDVAMLFLSGHGRNDAGEHYHYLPYDTDQSDLEFTTIQDFEIEGYLDKVPAMVIAFLDTCFSGGLHAKGSTQPDVDTLANKLSSPERGVVVFASSTGRQSSQEKPEWKNGAFTKALVEAFKGGADYEHDGTISVVALERYLEERVKELTNGEQSPTLADAETIDRRVIATVVP